MSTLRLHLEVTWPVCKTVDPLQRSRQLAGLLRCEWHRLRDDLVSIRDEGVYLRGLFGWRNKVPDIDRYEIVRAAEPEASPGASESEFQVAVREYQVANLEPSADAAGRVFVSTYPYVDRSVARGYGRPTLVIALESPHRDEYGDSVESPIAPARGSTGAGIHRHLCDVLNSCPQIRRTLFERTPVRVVISNPVPFQTSAYAIHGGRLGVSDRLRDFIWRELWHDQTLGLSAIFCAKLVCYTPIAITNACTAGGNPSRRTEVTRAIRVVRANGELRDVPLFKTSHPSRWHASTTLTAVAQ